MEDKKSSFEVPMMVITSTDNSIKNKDDLEKSLMNILSEFKSNTGVSVTEIHIEYSEVYTSLKGITMSNVPLNIKFVME